MIILREKSFALGMAIMNGLTVAGMAQAHKQGKEAEEQAERQIQEQRRMMKAQEKQNQKMMDTLNQVAKQNPAAAGAGAAAMMQQQFAIPANLAGTFKNIKGAVKDLAIVGKQMGAHKHASKMLAMGATAGAASYLVDKAVQADAKKNGIDLGPTEDTRKESGKKLAKVAGMAAATGLAIAGAKRGYLGNSLKTTTNKYVTKANLQKAGNTVKTAFKEQFVKPDAWKSAKGFKEKAKAINAGGLALTAGFAALPAIGYVGNKKAMKDQIQQTQQSSEERTYSINLAGLRNGMSSLGKNIKNSKTLGNIKGFFQKKVRPAVQNTTVPKTPTKPTVPISSFKEAPVRNVLGKISSFFGGGGQAGTYEFTGKLAQQGAKSGNKITQGAAKFLDNHKTLAVGGSIAAGSVLLKPFEIGDKAVKNTVGAVDKNAMKYEKSQNKQVEEE